jgi:3-mercaptopyruvate sulfurtransferase SseA
LSLKAGDTVVAEVVNAAQIQVIEVRRASGGTALVSEPVTLSDSATGHAPVAESVFVRQRLKPDTTKLPPEVVSFRDIARAAAQELIRG